MGHLLVDRQRPLLDRQGACHSASWWSGAVAQPEAGVQGVLGHALLAGVDGQMPVEGDPDSDELSGEGRGHAVAIAPHLPGGVPADPAELPVRRVVPPRR